MKINNLKDDNKNWGAKVVFKIDKQKGASEYNFTLKNLAILNDNQDKAQKKIDNNTAFIRIDKSVSSIDISAEVHIPRIITESLRKRLTYTVNVTPERSI